MRSKALFHLLLDRARHLRIHGSATASHFIEEVEDSLDAQFMDGTYKVSWRFRNQRYDATFAHTTFTFYFPGDFHQKQTTRNLRQENWEAAAYVWQQVVERSGQNWSDFQENSPNSMGLDLSVSVKQLPFPLLASFLLSIVAAVAIGLALRGWDSALLVPLICSACAGVALAYLARQRDGLRPAPWPAVVSDWAIVLAAAAVPAALNSEILMPLCGIAIVLATLHTVEKRLPWSALAWLPLFAVAAILVWVAQRSGFAAGMIIFAALWMGISLILPSRFNRLAVVAGCAGIIVAGVVGFGSADSSTPTWIALALAIPFAIMFGVGWFIGELFVLGPWLIHGALGFVALASFIVGDGVTAGAITFCAGFAVVEFVRMITAFRGTRAMPISFSSK